MSNLADDPVATERPLSRARRRRRIISLGTLAALVTLATGILTLKDQIFGSSDPGPKEQIPSYSDTGVSYFEGGAELVDFLQANDGNVVKLSVSFTEVPTYDTDPTNGSDPYVTIYHGPCQKRPPPGTTPDLVKHGCMGTNIVISGQDPAVPSHLYYSSFLRLQGYFAVQSAGSELHQGVFGIVLRALSVEEAHGIV